MLVIATTGRETHSRWGAVGQVYVVTPRTDPAEIELSETPIYQSKLVEQVDQDWDSNGKFAWCQGEYKVAAGTILRLYSVALRRGIIQGGGCVFLKVVEGAPQVRAFGQGYQGRVGWVQGPLVPILQDDWAAFGLVVQAKYKRYYRNRIEFATVEEKSNGIQTDNPLRELPVFDHAKILSATWITREVCR